MVKKVCAGALAVMLMFGCFLDIGFANYESDGYSKEGLVSKEKIRSLTDEFYENMRRQKTRSANVETLEVDRSNIIHLPAGSSPRPQLIKAEGRSFDFKSADTFKGYSINDERDFRIDVKSDYEEEYDNQRAVKGKLMAQGTNTNLWVLDDEDFHEETGTIHDDTCKLTDDTIGQKANELASAFDEIYLNMTGDNGFGKHEYLQTNYTNMPAVGDLDNDNMVNIVLYDIDALDSLEDGGGVYIVGFVSELDSMVFENEGDINNTGKVDAIDVFHIDIGQRQGWDLLDSDDGKYIIYGTLAHEFQHMLFYQHFGVFDSSADYSWYNESLSGLADTYYTQEGIEITDNSFMIEAAGNPYADSANDSYGDFLEFNGSLKNYGMGYLFSAFAHKSAEQKYAKNVYDFLTTGGMANDGSVEDFERKEEYINTNFKLESEDSTNAYLMVGAMLKAGFEQDDLSMDEALGVIYLAFMESFLCDGGQLNYGNGYYVELERIYNTKDKLKNLWYFRQLLIYEGGYSDSAPKIPTINSGENLILEGWQNNNGYDFATHDMLYKLDESRLQGTIAVTINDANEPFGKGFYYLALRSPFPGDSEEEYLNYKTEAYELLPNEETIIELDGKEPYLFATTFLESISKDHNVTVSYRYIEPSEHEILPTVYGPINAVCKPDDEMILEVVVIGGEDLSYQWYVSDSLESEGSAIENSNSDSLSLDTKDLGTKYYYCQVTSQGKEEIVTVTSEKSSVTVEDESILSSDNQAHMYTDEVIFSLDPKELQIGSKVNIYYEDKALSEEAQINTTGSAISFTYDTVTKQIPLGNHKVEAKVESEKGETTSYAMTLALNPSYLDCKLEEGQVLLYNGTKDYENLEMTCEDIAPNDDVDIYASGKVNDKNVGKEIDFTPLSISLEGEDKDYYRALWEPLDLAKVEIAQKDLTITAKNQRIKQGESPSFAVSSQGLVNGEVIESIEYSCDYNTNSPKGDYEISILDAVISGGESNYNINYQSGILTVEQKNTSGGQKDTDKVSKDSLVSIVEKLKSGEVADIKMEKTQKISSELLKLAKTKTIGLNLDYGGYIWTIDPQDINDVSGNVDVDLSIKTAQNSDISRLVLGSEIKQFEINYSGKLPFRAKLSLEVGNKHNQKQLSLYYFDEQTQKLEQKQTSKVTNGQVNYEFDHASKYVIVEDKTNNPTDSHFKDVLESDWYYTPVMTVVKEGIFAGTSQESFSPNMPMTRAMYVAVLWQLDGNKEAVNTGYYTDLAKNSYYEKAVYWAKDSGITMGIGEGKFAPEQNITREEMTTMFYQYLKYKENLPIGLDQNPTNFADESEISPWAKEAINYLNNGKLIGGKPENKFDPKGTTTRAEVAQIMFNHITT